MLFSDQLKHYNQTGWCKFDFDQRLFDWSISIFDDATEAVHASENQHWWRHQKTWFVGVNVLENNEFAATSKVSPLQCDALDFLKDQLNASVDQMDRAQISVCLPGYPKVDPQELPAAHRYRVNRDAAHIDGLLHEGPDKQRYAKEYHEYILLIPLTALDHGASPFVVWNNSHTIMQMALHAALKGYPSEQWPNVPITQAYKESRKNIFKCCERVEIQPKIGEAILAHRLLLHGTAPWAKGVKASECGRMFCFFRPQTLTPEQWLKL